MKKLLLVVLAGAMGTFDVKAVEYGDWAAPIAAGAAGLVAAGTGATAYVKCRARVRELEEEHALAVETLGQLYQKIDQIGVAMMNPTAMNLIAREMHSEYGEKIPSILDVYAKNKGVLDVSANKIRHGRGVRVLSHGQRSDLE